MAQTSTARSWFDLARILRGGFHADFAREDAEDYFETAEDAYYDKSCRLNAGESLWLTPGDAALLRYDVCWDSQYGYTLRRRCRHCGRGNHIYTHAREGKCLTTPYHFEAIWYE